MLVTHSAYFPRAFQEKKAGSRAKEEKKKKKKRRKGEGGEDGNRVRREEANRDGSSL